MNLPRPANIDVSKKIIAVHQTLEDYWIKSFPIYIISGFSFGAKIATWHPSTAPTTWGKPARMKKAAISISMSCRVTGKWTIFLRLKPRFINYVLFESRHCNSWRCSSNKQKLELWLNIHFTDTFVENNNNIDTCILKSTNLSQQQEKL